ncbi:MAG: hypothetical protein K2X74_08095 [Acetobacteraceae bacterium]|nr:hypothetical protein [Acetobacteraceae bacterium]
MTDDANTIAAQRHAWAALAPQLGMLEPLEFGPEEWAFLARLRADFTARPVHVRLPMPIARFRGEARDAILALARQRGDVETGTTDEDGASPADRAMAGFARAFGRDVDALLGVLIPAARHRKGHFAHGLFTTPEPHGLHTDHSAEDPAAGAEPICIARLGALGTHCVAGDMRTHDARTRRMLDALRYWTPVPEGEPEDVLQVLLREGVLRTIPLDHVVLMVAGNGRGDAQVTPHIAARPPEGGIHSAFFQRQYRLA